MSWEWDKIVAVSGMVSALAASLAAYYSIMQSKQVFDSNLHTRRIEICQESIETAHATMGLIAENNSTLLKKTDGTLNDKMIQFSWLLEDDTVPAWAKVPYVNLAVSELNIRRKLNEKHSYLVGKTFVLSDKLKAKIESFFNRVVIYLEKKETIQISNSNLVEHPTNKFLGLINSDIASAYNEIVSACKNEVKLGKL